MSTPESIGQIMPRVLSSMAKKLSPQLRADVRLIAKTFPGVQVFDAEAQVWRKVRLLEDAGK